MQALEKRAFEARIGLHTLCKNAQPRVSGTSLTRWRRGVATPSLNTIGRLEKALAVLTQEQSQ